LFVEIHTVKGEKMLINLDQILYCCEYRGGLRIEMQDGTPIDVATSVEGFEQAVVKVFGRFASCDPKKS